MSDVDQEIRELIDQGSLSQAQQIVNQKLRKFPNRSYYHALNNQILFARGSTNDAVAKNQKLVEQIPSDPATLKVLFDFFNQLGLKKEANSVYENAVKKYPSRSLIFEWFKSSITTFDSKLYQRILMILQKNDKTNRLHAFWAAFGCVMLTSSSSDPKQKSLFNMLGLKLLENFKPFNNDQELFVFVKLLDKDWERIVKEMDEAPKNLINLDLQLIYLNSLKSLGNAQALFQKSQFLIFEEDFNDFDTWKYLIWSSKELGKDFEEVETLIKSSNHPRNLALSLIELAMVYKKDLSVYFKAYFDNFSYKSCCFDDMKSYLQSLDVSQISTYMEDSPRKSDPASILTHKVNSQKFAFLYDEENTSKNVSIYNDFKDSLSQRSEFDVYPANELIVTNILSDIHQNKSLSSVFKGIVQLQKILSYDPNDPHSRLWLLKLSSYFNLPNISKDNYDAMKIKMVQHDTLGHYLNLIPSASSINYLINIYRFYLTAEYEIDESVIKGFEKSAFTKLEGFCSFGKRITHSIAKYALIIKILKFSKVIRNNQYVGYFLKSIKSIEADLLNESLEMYDNRDYKTVWKFGSHREQELFLDEPKKSQEFVKLELLKFLILEETDKVKTNKLIKVFNKLLSSSSLASQLTEFESWIFKIYLNLFKLTKLEYSKESESISNYFNKNLKFTKVKNLILTDNLLSRASEDNLVYVLELMMDIQTQAHLSSFKENNLLTLRNQFIKDLKQLDFISLKRQHLKSIGESLNITDNEIFDSSYKDDIFNTLDDFLSQSHSILKYI